MADIKKILDGMTLKEKIGQLAQFNANIFIDTNANITGPLSKLNVTKEELSTVGSVLNFKTPLEMRRIQRQHLIDDRNKIPMLFMMDVIHGYRTIYPIPLAMAGSFNTDIVKECAKMAAREAVVGGIQVTFTPMVDFVRDARWGRVMESAGEDSLLGGVMGAVQVRAFEGDNLSDKNNIAACVKHFAAYGGADTGLDYSPVDISEHTLREHYLPAYKACTDAGVSMLMPSYTAVNGVPSVANKWLMQTILKDEWGYDGLIISDYGAVRDLVEHGIAADEREAAEMAFKNGVEIEMVSVYYLKYLEALVNDGKISEADIDRAVLKVLGLKNRLGMFEDPYRGASEEEESPLWLTKENRDIVRHGAEESCVLLKNDGILPFDISTGRIAIIGPFADNKQIIGFWACSGKDEESVTVKEGIAKLLPNAEIRVAVGCSDEWDDISEDGFAEAIDAARWADAVVLCLGEPQDYSGEGNSRVELELHEIQIKLAKAVAEVNTNIAALTFSGRPIVLSDLAASVPAILHMWFPGTEGGSAAANILFGKVNPSGKLAMTFPRATGQCPIYYNHTRVIRQGRTGAHNPYCASYIECEMSPLYSFGYGLSYSNFVYESLELSADSMTKNGTVNVTVTVHNDSDVAGKETVMLYMQDVVASNARPIQQLIAFEKVHFEAWERRSIKFEINEKMLRFPNNENKLVSESGEFKISTGYADNLKYTRSLWLK